ncbi:MAG TPA: hypothetical protein VIH26_02695 [Anaerolineales bacterium]
MQGRTAREVLAQIPSLRKHPQFERLLEIVTGETDLSSAGFPYISDTSFRILRDQVPHLFRQGAAVLGCLAALEEVLARRTDFSPGELESIQRAITVVRTVVLTAGITAPPDLWLLKHLISAHQELGILEWLLSGRALHSEVLAREHSLNFRQLETDLRFLHSRGYLLKGDGAFLLPSNPAILNVMQQLAAIPSEPRPNLVPRLGEWFSSPTRNDAQLRSWLDLGIDDQPTGSWVASHFQVELGYRLLPCVLALRTLEITKQLARGARLATLVPNFPTVLERLFELAGWSESGVVSELGARGFERGPGVFGIIAAYHPYVSNLEDILRSRLSGTWVRRAENVAASQDANRKTFEIANDKLDLFCKQYRYEYRVFIEHAAGRGEAIRQRYLRDGEQQAKYFAADLEDTAIDQAIGLQEQGILPASLQFIRSADIGEPDRVIQFLARQELAGEPTVMMVGNGFHEIRNQTNEKMVEVFRGYEHAGFVLIFTEESALDDEALLDTAWNTYHAGFRYVHEMSGQGLRPPAEGEYGAQRWSWRKCGELAGYVFLDEFSYRSRSIYPYRRPTHKNPSISVTYFCIPAKLAQELRIESVQGKSDTASAAWI